MTVLCVEGYPRSSTHPAGQRRRHRLPGTALASTEGFHPNRATAGHDPKHRDAPDRYKTGSVAAPLRIENMPIPLV